MINTEYNHITQSYGMEKKDSPPQNPPAAETTELSIQETLIEKGIIDQSGEIINLDALPDLPPLPEASMERLFNLLNTTETIEIKVEDWMKEEYAKRPGTKEHLDAFNAKKITSFNVDIHHLEILQRCESRGKNNRTEIKGGATLYILGPMIEEILAPLGINISESLKERLNTPPRDTDICNKNNDFSVKDLLSISSAGLCKEGMDPLYQFFILRSLRKVFIKIEGQENASIQAGTLDLLIARSVERDHLYSTDNFHIPISDYLAGKTSQIKLPPDTKREIWQAILDNVTRTIHISDPESINEKGAIRFFYQLTKGYQYLSKKEHLELIEKLPFYKIEGIDAKIDQILHSRNDKTASTKIALFLNLLTSIRPQGKSDFDKIGIPKKTDSDETETLLEIGRLLKHNSTTFSVVEALYQYLALTNLAENFSHSPCRFGEKEAIQIHFGKRHWTFPANLEKCLKTLSSTNTLTAQKQLLPAFLRNISFANPPSKITPSQSLFTQINKCKNSNSSLLHIIGLHLLTSLDNKKLLLTFYAKHQSSIQAHPECKLLDERIKEQLRDEYPTMQFTSKDWIKNALLDLTHVDAPLSSQLYKLLSSEEQNQIKSSYIKRIIETEPRLALEVCDKENFLFCLSKCYQSQNLLPRLIRLAKEMPKTMELPPKQLQALANHAIATNALEDGEWLDKKMDENNRINLFGELGLTALNEGKLEAAFDLWTLLQKTSEPQRYDQFTTELTTALIKEHPELAKEVIITTQNPSHAKKLIAKETKKKSPTEKLRLMEQEYCSCIQNDLAGPRTKIISELETSQALIESITLLESDLLPIKALEVLMPNLFSKFPQDPKRNPQWEQLLKLLPPLKTWPLTTTVKLLDEKTYTEKAIQSLIQMNPSLEQAQLLSETSKSWSSALTNDFNQNIGPIIQLLIDQNQGPLLLKILSPLATSNVSIPQALSDIALQIINDQEKDWNAFGQLLLDLKVPANSPLYKNSKLSSSIKDPLLCLELLKQEESTNEKLWKQKISELVKSTQTQNILPILLYAESLGYVSNSAWEQCFKKIEVSEIETILGAEHSTFLSEKLENNKIKKALKEKLYKAICQLTKDSLEERHFSLLSEFIPTITDSNILLKALPISNELLLEELVTQIIKNPKKLNFNTTKQIINRNIHFKQFHKAHDLLCKDAIYNQITEEQIHRLDFEILSKEEISSDEDECRLTAQFLKYQPNHPRAAKLLRSVKTKMIKKLTEEGDDYFFRTSFAQLLGSISSQDRSWILNENKRSRYDDPDWVFKNLHLKKDLGEGVIVPRPTSFFDRETISFMMDLYNKILAKPPIDHDTHYKTLKQAHRLITPLLRGAPNSRRAELQKMISDFFDYDIKNADPFLTSFHHYLCENIVINSSEPKVFTNMKKLDCLFLSIRTYPEIDDSNRKYIADHIKKRVPQLIESTNPWHIYLAMFYFTNPQLNDPSIHEEVLNTYFPAIIAQLQHLNYFKFYEVNAEGRSLNSIFPSLINSLFSDPLVADPLTDEEYTASCEVVSALFKFLIQLKNDDSKRKDLKEKDITEILKSAFENCSYRLQTHIANKFPLDLLEYTFPH